MKTLSIIVPIYGKDPLTTFNNLKEVVATSNKNVEFILIYKNSDLLNYDILKMLERENIIVEKVDCNFKRTNKIKLGISLANSKYLFVLDSHHSLDKNGLEKLILYLHSSNDDLIFTIPKQLNVDTSEVIINDYDSTTAGRYIVKTGISKHAISNVDFDIVYHDDWTLGMSFTYYKYDIKINWWKDCFYIKKFGEGLSKTFAKFDFDSLLKMIKDSRTILEFFINDKKNNHNKLISEAFKNQFTMLLNGYISRFLKLADIKESDLNRDICIEILSYVKGLLVNYEDFISLSYEKNKLVNLFFKLISKKTKSINYESKEKVDVVFSFDNIEQEYFFKKTVNTLEDIDNVNINIFCPESYKDIEWEKDFVREIFSIGFNKVNLFRVSGNDPFDKHAKFYWMRAPFFIENESNRMIILDNDLSFNCDLNEIIAYSKDDSKLMWGAKVPNILNHPYKRHAFNILIDNSETFIERNYKKYINFGIAVVNTKLWKENFNSLDEIVAYGNKRLIFFNENKLFLSDQDFLWSIHGDKFGFIPSFYNIRLHDFSDKILLQKQNWILHYNLWNDKEVRKFDFYNMFKKCEAADSKEHLESILESCVDFYKNKKLSDNNRKAFNREIKTFRNKIRLLAKSYGFFDKFNINNNLTLVIPWGEIDDEKPMLLLKSIKKSSNFIGKIVVINNEESVGFLKFVSLFDDNFLNKNKIKFYSEAVGKDTTKPQKLSKSLKYIEDKDMVLVVDVDDEISIPTLINEIDFFNNDVILFPYLRNRIGDYAIGKSIQDLMFFTNESLSWPNMPNYFPYFGNHSTLVKGEIFKKVQSDLVTASFQRNEDVLRVYLYLSFAKTIHYFKIDNFIIRNVYKDSQHHALNMKDIKKLSDWMNTLVENIVDVFPKDINLECSIGILKDEVVKSIYSAKYEIANTIKKVSEDDANILNEKTLEFSKKWLSLSNEYLEE